MYQIRTVYRSLFPDPLRNLRSAEEMYTKYPGYLDKLYLHPENKVICRVRGRVLQVIGKQSNSLSKCFVYVHLFLCTCSTREYKIYHRRGRHHLKAFFHLALQTTYWWGAWSRNIYRANAMSMQRTTHVTFLLSRYVP